MGELRVNFIFFVNFAEIIEEFENVLRFRIKIGDNGWNELYLDI